MATFEQKQSRIHAIEGNISSLSILLMNEIAKLADVINEIDNGAIDYLTPKGNKYNTLTNAYNQTKELAKEFDIVNDVMSAIAPNGHDISLVEKINKCYADVSKRIAFEDILYKLACRDMLEVKEKLNCNFSDLIQMTPSKFFALYSWEMLTHICDDADLVTILDYCNFK